VASFDERLAGYEIELIEPLRSPVTDSEPVDN